MKIRFTEAPKGREFKVGDIVEFKGPVPEGYARKYIARGWAVEHVEEKPVPVARKIEAVVAVAADEIVTIEPKAKPVPNGKP